jgi:hypothetical protein
MGSRGWRIDVLKGIRSIAVTAYRLLLKSRCNREEGGREQDKLLDSHMSIFALGLRYFR